MITQLELGNIRLFDGVGHWKFPITPLSVFCGTNSAGKSTILKCLLLLLQSNDTSDVMAGSGQLRLAGSLVDFGSYESFVSHRDITRDVVIGISTRNLVKTRTLRRARPKKQVQQAGPESEYTPYTLSSTFRFGVLEREERSSQLPLPDELSGVSFDRSSFTNQGYLKEASFQFEAEGYSLDWTIAVRSSKLKKGEEPEYEISIPQDHFGISGGYSIIDSPKVGIGTHVRIEALLRGILPMGLWAKAKRRTRVADEDDLWSFFPLPPLIKEIIDNLAVEFNAVHYLGPLRSPAKRFYLTHLDTTPRMDTAGDFLPYILRDRGEAPVSYFPPGIEQEREGTLRQGVDEWLFYLRTGKTYTSEGESRAHEIDFTSVREVLLEFTLQSFGGESHALADSGFGYSQLLPIVVAGLVAEFEETIAIEQPELHLNPALQVRMAEFLRSIARAGKTVLLETHSEHIINALRVLAAENQTVTEVADCSILFLDTEKGAPLIRRLEIQSDGNIPEWPRSFMGEAMHLSSRLLRAQQRRLKQPSEHAG